MTTQGKEIIARLRELIAKPHLKWTGWDVDEWQEFTSYNNIAAILDYVAELEKKVTEISSGYMHCQAAFALLDEKYRNRKVKA